MLNASIVGASGYVGGELLRLLLGHPAIQPVQATSERLAGRFVHSVHPNLRGSTQLRFSRLDDLERSDILFLCLPHGSASRDIDRFGDLADLVVDCSADFRLRDASAHTQWYGEAPETNGWRERFVYGLPELERQRLAGARAISGVGCNATATILGLWPLADAGLIDEVVVEVKVGSSEGGARESAASHHPERSGALRSFAPTGHRHQAEICQQLQLDPERLHFSATAVERIRGVLATCHVFLTRAVDDREVWRLYRQAYGDEPFVRIVRERRGLYRYPEPKVLTGTNFCDVGWVLDDAPGERPRLVVLSAIDNLVKGAAGSAIQSTNVALGLDETSGLGFVGLHPC